ncbi:transcriptional regulator GutM [Anaerostipes butyraticus]|uniref:Glucitol operon activator protein (GutM) n=1 Tax=Anaerostipes butyraticus TaxID=645466 RepID=A0A916VC88_9FIRM|nr:transcriptional regulator GutM [Anaerostipes butyraticus]GFO84909.1 hypothetical protein ANBU17_12560 [Anaerostipes butyraticus]HJC82646.1 transcriptional regulator GutM [Candidatus Anaerostipes avicola]
MQIRTILGILFVVLILQAVFSLFQIRQIYQTMEQQKQLYRGKDYTLAIGSSRSSLRSLSKGVIMILVVNQDQIIQDFHLLEGFSVLSRMRQMPDYIGRSIQDLSLVLKSKNQKKALASAAEQITSQTAC